MELDDELKVIRCENFLFGKVADSFKSTNNTKNIVLKAYFDTNRNEYIYSDTNSKIIPVNISYSTVNIIKNYSHINLKYVSLLDLYTLRKEITRFGYSDEDINFELLIKNIEPITYLLLSVTPTLDKISLKFVPIGTFIILGLSTSPKIDIYFEVTGISFKLS